MFKFIDVKLNERVVVFRDGLPYRALGPGSHTVWGSGLTVQKWDTDAQVFYAPAEVRAVLPADWFREVSIGEHERGVVYWNGRPRYFLRPGLRWFWTVDSTVELRVFSVLEPMPELTDELASVVPKNEYVERLVQEHERGLEFVQGRLVAVLAPGRYARWTYPGAPVRFDTVDMRRQQVAIVGQDLMTRDKVTLRLSLSVEYAIEDPGKASLAVSDVRDSVYLIVQLAARDYVAGVTLDELLESREGMTRFLEENTVPKASAFGVRVERVGVKDVVLPGEMKTLLNRVIEAEKEAAANVILRREETAATRSLANTARVMADHPVLLRLKELEAMKEIAERIQEVRVVVGADGLDKLLPAQLLATKNGN